MVNERPKQFAGPPRFVGAAGASQAPYHRSQGSATLSASPSASRVNKLGLGLGTAARGLGKGKGKGMKRHFKIQRDTIYGVTKGDIRRLARRGGVKRISGTIYDDVRNELKERLKSILKEVIAVVEYGQRKTVTVRDIIFVLNRQGRTIYGF